MTRMTIVNAATSKTKIKQTSNVSTVLFLQCLIVNAATSKSEIKQISNIPIVLFLLKLPLYNV